LNTPEYEKVFFGMSPVCMYPLVGRILVVCSIVGSIHCGVIPGDYEHIPETKNGGFFEAALMVLIKLL
jgi:hypothetical protein